MITTKVYSSKFIDKLSEHILSANELKEYHKLFLHTWFVRVDFEEPKQIIEMCKNLKRYITTGEKTLFLTNIVKSHPKMFDWFGKTLIGNEYVVKILDNIINELYIPKKYSASNFVYEIEDYFFNLKPADILSKLIGIDYCGEELRFIICEFLSHPYNLYPDTIVHKRAENKIWYIAGFGHEFGHILTWDLVDDIRALNLCNNPVTKSFAEMIAHVCSKLLMEYYGFNIIDLSPDIKSWHNFGFSTKHPGYKLYCELIDEMKASIGNQFKDSCINILEKYQ